MPRTGLWNHTYGLVKGLPVPRISRAPKPCSCHQPLAPQMALLPQGEEGGVLRRGMWVRRPRSSPESPLRGVPSLRFSTVDGVTECPPRRAARADARDSCAPGAVSVPAVEGPRQLSLQLRRCQAQGWMPGPCPQSLSQGLPSLRAPTSPWSLWPRHAAGAGRDPGTAGPGRPPGSWGS